MTAGALEGIRILDLTQVWAGPTCTKILGDMGAEVIKVESARRMDIARSEVSPRPGTGLYPNNEPGELPWNRAGRFADRNRSKLSACLDLTHERGVDAFKRIAANSDVVIENYRQGVMDRFGLGFEQLKEARSDIVMVSLSSQGTTGPERSYGSFGVTLEQTAGTASITGYAGGDPMTSGVLFPDPVVAVVAIGFILSALRQRRETGEGCYVDLSQREMTTSIIGEMVMDYTMNGRKWKPIGNRHPVFAPQGVYRCDGHDAWIAITVRSDEEWSALARTIGQPELATDPRFASQDARADNHDQLDLLISAWTESRSPFEVMTTLQAVGVPAGVAETGEQLLEDPHLVSRDFWELSGLPDQEQLPYLSRPFKFSLTPGSTRMPAPPLGQETEQVLRDVAGMTEDDLRELVELGVTSNDPRPFAANAGF